MTTRRIAEVLERPERVQTLSQDEVDSLLRERASRLPPDTLQLPDAEKRWLLNRLLTIDKQRRDKNLPPSTEPFKYINMSIDVLREFAKQRRLIGANVPPRSTLVTLVEQTPPSLSSSVDRKTSPSRRAAEEAAAASVRRQRSASRERSAALEREQFSSRERRSPPRALPREQSPLRISRSRSRSPGRRTSREEQEEEEEEEERTRAIQNTILPPTPPLSTLVGEQKREPTSLVDYRVDDTRLEDFIRQRREAEQLEEQRRRLERMQVTQQYPQQQQYPRAEDSPTGLLVFRNGRLEPLLSEADLNLEAYTPPPVVPPPDFEGSREQKLLGNIHRIINAFHADINYSPELRAVVATPPPREEALAYAEEPTLPPQPLLLPVLQETKEHKPLLSAEQTARIEAGLRALDAGPAQAPALPLPLLPTVSFLQRGDIPQSPFSQPSLPLVPYDPLQQQQQQQQQEFFPSPSPSPSDLNALLSQGSFLSRGLSSTSAFGLGERTFSVAGNLLGRTATGRSTFGTTANSGDNNNCCEETNRGAACFDVVRGASEDHSQVCIGRCAAQIGRWIESNAARMASDVKRGGALNIKRVVEEPTSGGGQIGSVVQSPATAFIKQSGIELSVLYQPINVASARGSAASAAGGSTTGGVRASLALGIYLPLIGLNYVLEASDVQAAVINQETRLRSALSSSTSSSSAAPIQTALERGWVAPLARVAAGQYSPVVYGNDLLVTAEVLRALSLALLDRVPAANNPLLFLLEDLSRAARSEAAASTLNNNGRLSAADGQPRLSLHLSVPLKNPNSPQAQPQQQSVRLEVHVDGLRVTGPLFARLVPHLARLYPPFIEGALPPPLLRAPLPGCAPPSSTVRRFY